MKTVHVVLGDLDDIDRRLQGIMTPEREPTIHATRELAESEKKRLDAALILGVRYARFGASYKSPYRVVELPVEGAASLVDLVRECCVSNTTVAVKLGVVLGDLGYGWVPHLAVSWADAPGSEPMNGLSITNVSDEMLLGAIAQVRDILRRRK